MDGRLTWLLAEVAALVDELRSGDRIELRGPIGGYFVWEPADGGPCGWWPAAAASSR